jgi:CRISPR-associated endonuclease/helicase Cas3
MYKLIDSDALISGNTYLAHKDGFSGQDELLIQHLKLTIKYFDEYQCNKSLESKIKKILELCGFEKAEIDEGYNLFVNAVFLHDIGKINPAYQSDVMKNRNFKGNYMWSSEHSIYSAYIYIGEHIKIYGRLGRRLTYLLYAFSYVISCHHGRLGSLDGFYEKLKYCEISEFYDFDISEILESVDFIGTQLSRVKESILNPEAFYILCRLLFACITSCDFSATGEYKTNNRYNMALIDDIRSLTEKYYNGKLYKSISAYKKKELTGISEINDLRTELFLEAQEGLLKDTSANIYYLEAPTGSGKTNCSINLALKLFEKDSTLNNLFYIFPFNTLVEQTADVLIEYFSENAVVINSVTPIANEDMKSEELDYEALLINRINNNYPLVITTHVNFFNTLFGVKREQSFPLLKLCNSVVIIDEIQSYKNRIWPEIISFLNCYAQVLNIRIIIMSATLPRVDEVFGFKGNFHSLLSDSSKFYTHPLFMDRVIIDTNLMKYEELQNEQLLNAVLEHKNKKVLIEFITKAGAREFYNFCLYNCPELKDVLYELSGDDCSTTRKVIIEKTRESKSMVLIATQVIEAGVDIDMDIGFKEISLADSEEQFLGRINRSCRKEGCRAYFFRKTRVGNIYRADCRTNHTIEDANIMEYLINKNFRAIYEKVLKDLKVLRSKKNTQNFERLKDIAIIPDFKEIFCRMQLIEPSFQVFIPYIFKYENEEINGYVIWEEYEQLTNSNDGYARKKILLSSIRAKMSPFIFNIEMKGQDKDNIPFSQLGGIYYIDNGEQFIENGKFNRKLFISSFRGRFL